MRSPTSRRTLALATALSALAFGVAACGSSGTSFVVTGLVLLAAVTVDSFARRRQERAGRT